jgi:hypothetical protein
MVTQQILEQIPDAVKVGVTLSPTVLTLFGIPVDQLAWILSMIVSCLFIIEKAPTTYKRIKSFLAWIKSKLK